MQRDVIFHPDSIKLDIDSPAVFYLLALEPFGGERRKVLM